MGSKAVYEIVKEMGTELHGYKQRKIFTPQEIQDILEQRKKHELKLQRKKKNSCDFLNYIKYEKKILKKRNKRMEEKMIIKEETDSQLEKNILRIYNKIFFNFDGSDILEEFSAFCIRNGFIEEMKNVFASQTLKHSENEKLWLLCSSKIWETEDIEAARAMLIKGMEIVKNVNLLMVAFFKMEVEYAGKLFRYSREMGINENEIGDIEKGNVALECFKEISKKCGKIEVEQCLRLSKNLPGLVEKCKGFLSENL